MRLSASPTGVDTVGGVVEWLRTQLSSIAAGWNVEHTPNGTHDWHWADVPIGSVEFGASSGTWTASPSHFRYGVLGDLMVVTVRIVESSVSATPVFLYLPLPPGYAVADEGWAGTVRIGDNSATEVVGALRAATPLRYIYVAKGDGAAFTASTASTSVIGSILLRVTKD